MAKKSKWMAVASLIGAMPMTALQAQGGSEEIFDFLYADSESPPSGEVQVVEPSAGGAGSNAPSAVDGAPTPDPLPQQAGDAGSAPADTSPVVYESTIPLQDEAPAAENVRAAPRGRQLEEIVVTAQRREQSLQDVPIAVSAFSADQLANAGVSEPLELSRITPGMQMTEAVGFSVSYLRGVGADGFLMADPSVATYIDGVYMPIAMGVDQKFGEIERIEVLKGPQGTLFGRNVIGGAINIVSKKPDPKEFNLTLSYEAGDYDTQIASAHANIPILDNLAISASALYDYRDSYYDGVMNLGISNPTGDQVPGERSVGGKLRLLYQPTDWIEMTATWSHSDTDGIRGLYSPNVAPSPLGLLLGIRAQEGYEGTRTSNEAMLPVENDVVAADILAQLDTFDIKAAGSYQHFFAQNAIDIDGSALPLAGFNIKRYFAHATTGELQLMSNDGSWRSDQFEWILGLYYFGAENGVNPSDIFVGGLDLRLGTIAGIDLTTLPGLGGIVGGLLRWLEQSPLSSVVPNGELIFDGVLGTESYSVYTQGTYDFTDWAALTLGGRYQRERRWIIDSRSFTNTFDDTRGVLLFDNRNNPDLISEKFTPKVGLTFRPQGSWLPGSDWLLYANWQEAMKAGLYNVINVIDFTAEEIKPEEISAYEVGFKSKFLDGRVNASGAAFFYDQKNVQIQYFSLLAGGAITFTNADAAQVKGAELDLMIAATEGLTVTLSGAYLDAEFTSFPKGQGYTESGIFLPPQNLPLLFQDFTGNVVPRSPEFTGRVALSQVFNFNRSTLELAADYYYNSGFYTQASNTSSTYQPAYALINGRVSWEYIPWNVKLSAMMQNIADEQYSVGRFDTDFGTLAALAPPRTIGLRVDWSFR